uniref:Reactive oxygen species modulator 1 n=1 Tax=Meloidogyne hapla TaxID=6305 RepID=A0A1I8BHJ6_MELHA
MPVPQGYQQQVSQQRQGLSCFDKLKMGFLMGCMIGGSTGVIIGTFTTLRFQNRLKSLKISNNLRAGLRGREALRQIGKVATQMGGSFGVFMTVAQGIRC